MNEKELYSRLLNLSELWVVRALILDEIAGSVTVTVGIAEGTRLACPACGKSCSVHDHRHRKWRHLDTCQFTTIVEADVPRIMCPEHGCQTLPVPWAGPGSRYTLLFESFVLSWLKISTVDAVRKQLKLSWNAVDGIMTRAVKRGLSRIKKPLSACHMNVDEVAFKKGHRYITVISDRDGQALALTDDRGTVSLASYLRTLTDTQLLVVKTLSMDMNAGYIRAARFHLPNVKELAKDIWNSPWSEERRNDWQRWLALAANSDVPMMKNAAKTIGKRLYGILNAMRHGVSNGNAEALNSKIRLLGIKARGDRNRERFKLGVMFHYGKLNMAF